MDNTSIITKIEEYCDELYKSKNTQKIGEIDKILSNFMSFKNFELLKILLYQSSSKHAKYYAAKALMILITENYLSVEISEKLEIYQNLINFIQTNSEDLYLNSRFLLNNLISLLCRIVRISWLQNEKFKEIIDDVLKTVKEENSFSMIIPFLIYAELIYQFQLPDIPPTNKLYRYISDFKDFALFPIYENATNFLINIFKQDIKFEKIEHCIIFINELSNCINECMEYEEDLNIKVDNYKKFEIKPIYVPNNKKRSKDKTLNIEALNLICKSLFDTHNIIAKLVKDHNMSNTLKTDKCLCLLQKYCSIKIVYLGDYKILFLKNIQNGIINLIHTKIGLDNDKNLEEFCKLIFLLKKNFTVMELLENINFIEQIFKFTLECIQYYPASISGLIYLIRFFGYFSSILAAHPIPNKEDVKNLINELVSILLKKSFSIFDQELEIESFEDLQKQKNNLFLDLVDAVALISRGILKNVNISFLEFFNNIIMSLNTPNCLNLNLALKINCLLYYATAVISFNQRVLLEKDFINKVMDQEDHTRIEVNDINVDDILIYDEDSENFNECQIICEILTKIFQIMEFYINTIKLINVNSTNESNFDIKFIIQMEPGIFYFLKNFCKLFLSKKLSQKYSNIFHSLSETLKLKDNSMILNFIISFLVEVCKVNQIKSNDYFLYQKVIKIFKIIVNNLYLNFDFRTGEKFLFIGKLLIQENFMNSVLEMPEILVKFDPIVLGKYRTIFYESINRIILMKTYPRNDDLFLFILKFYTDNIFIRKDMLSGNEKVGYDLLGYMKDLKGICCSISVKEDYKKFIDQIFQSLLILQQFYKENCFIVEVNISYLKLFEEIINNKHERIYFPQNCKYYLCLIIYLYLLATLPIEFLKLANDVLQHYKNYNNHQIQMDSQEEYLKRINPIVLIAKIFKNIFIGKYIQFGSLISMNLKYFQEILYSLCDLIFSIKLENILNYSSKTNVFYFIIKVVFCEYSKYIDPEFYKFGDVLIKLIQEGIDSLDNVVLITTHQIIYEIGKLFLKSKNKQSLSNHGHFTDNENPVMITFLFTKYEENFQNILEKMFHSLLNGEITSLNEMSNSFFVLVAIYNTFYLNLLNNLILTQFGQDLNKQNKVRCAFEQLFKNVKSSFDSYNLINFQKGLKEFANEIQTLI